MVINWNYWKQHDPTFMATANLKYFNKDIIHTNVSQENELFINIMKDSPENSAFLDVGAYTGDTTIPVALKLVELGRTDIHLHAFEPNANNCMKIKKKMQQHNLKNVHIHEYVITDRNQPVYMNPASRSSGTMYDTCFVSNKAFDGKTLDSFNIKNAYLLKIDVEGHETEVLKGGKTTTDSAKFIHIEMWNNSHFNARHGKRHNYDHNKNILSQISDKLYPVQKIEKNILFTSLVDKYEQYLTVFNKNIKKSIL